MAEPPGAGIGMGLAGQIAHQARLAGAVEPHDQEPLAPPLDRERDVVEHRGTAVALREAVGLDRPAPAGRGTSPDASLRSGR